jgi:alpha-N-arabinofuranosidase
VISCVAHVDGDFRTGRIDRRLFGSFVEHLDRCVYGGVYEPGSRYADADGFRTDVLELTRELGVSVVRYPGGNFVSGYRWEDGIGPVSQRPARFDPAWEAVENNEFGLHEFMNWAARAGTEPMLAVNLGTRGLQEACDMLEYANHSSGTALADLRARNGSREPFGVRLWCLGNELDGPWQIGHKSAEAYGVLAAQTAMAMRRIDPAVELVACGSSNPRMPTLGSWEATVLDHTYEHVDYISLHVYYEQHNDDLASFLASGWDMDGYIDGVLATADHVAARKRSRKRMQLSFDEWNVVYPKRHGRRAWPERTTGRQVPDDRYSGLDAVVAGNLLMSLLRHADRIGVACLAQLVNVIAPIWAEPGQPAWRQTTFHPIALTARHATGDVLDVRCRSDAMDTLAYGDVPAVDVVATVADSDRQLCVLAVNRHLTESAQLTVTLRGLPGLQVADHVTIGGPDQLAMVNSAGQPEAVRPRPVAGAGVKDGELRAQLGPASWHLIRLESTL